MLHEKDLSRIQMKIFCPEDEEIIHRTDTVKGYEYAPDKYVVINDEDLEKLPLKTVRSIEIEQFVDAQTRPRATEVREAGLLHRARPGRPQGVRAPQGRPAGQGLTAICKIVIRDREVLAALDPFENTMLLSTLYWPDEIRALGELDLPGGRAGDQAGREEDGGAADRGDDRRVRPGAVPRRVSRGAMQVIESKIEGRETVEIEPAEEPTKLVDLMAALQASVNAATSARDAKSGKPVSVAEAKEQRAAKGKAATKAASKPAAKADESEEERPARRRKSA